MQRSRGAEPRDVAFIFLRCQSHLGARWSGTLDVYPVHAAWVSVLEGSFPPGILPGRVNSPWFVLGLYRLGPALATVQGFFSASPHSLALAPQCSLPLPPNREGLDGGPPPAHSQLLSGGCTSFALSIPWGLPGWDSITSVVFLLSVLFLLW